MNQNQQSQLKQLITKGKEQGFLTYAQVNDHLPDDIVDPEQIEDIINMINDMGISVHEKAPDTDTLILNDSASSDADDDSAAEEAAAALAAVETEIGRTTDPVRMYMREMGTVELLTREGEIAIAKRIEAGLKQVHASLARFPGTIAILLASFIRFSEGRQRLAELMADFIDPNAPEMPIPQAKKPTDKTDDDDEEEEDPGPQGPDPEEVQAFFTKMGKLNARFVKLNDKHGHDYPRADKIRAEMAEMFMHLKMPPKMVDHLVDRLRYTVSQQRHLERMIVQLAVAQAKMPKRTFITSYTGNESNSKWLAPLLKGKQKWVPALKQVAPDIKLISPVYWMQW